MALTYENLTSGDKYAIFIDGKCVNDGVVTRAVLHEVAIRKLPLFDVVWRCRRHCVSTTDVCNTLQFACDSATRYIVQHTVLFARLLQDLVHSGISLMTKE